MKLIVVLISLFTASLSFGQKPWTAEDSLKGEAMVKTIEQSLSMYYAEMSPTDNYDSIIEALNFEADSVPEYSDEVYCERLNTMNEMSPFHLDCNDATLKTIRFFAKKRRGFTRVVMGRSSLYFDMFEEKLAAHGLPIELKYLSVIESGLRPQVKSRAGALGLWQFMYRTGRMYGLNENSYFDERMDPELATEAACRYLKKLYEIYNDWNLALAAYNAGPGNVNKAIRRSGNKLTYWEIRPFLPRETQGYVPNFIAAAYLITYHAEHNIIPAEAVIEYSQLDTMCLTQGLHFTTISSFTGMDLDEIKKLNPIYKRDYVPKTIPGQCVSLPLEIVGNLVTQEDSMYIVEHENYVKNTPSTSTKTTTSANTTYQTHKVNAGETLGTIAAKYGTTVREIQRINGFSSTKIYVGQRIKVKQGAAKATVYKPKATPKNTTTGNKSYYTVRSGDTFGKIAQRHRLSTSQLKSLNPRINIDRLSIGQKLRVK